MAKSIYLQDIAEGIQYGNLPDTWQTEKLANFSPTITLYDYQENALKSAIKILHLYFEQCANWQPNESKETINKRKKTLFDIYESNGLKVDEYKINDTNGNYDVLEKYYDINSDKSISYQNLINRMSFWMATGSGKTLVLVKMIEILTNLIKNQEIPNNDILLLIPRDDLIKQLKDTVLIYNQNTLGKKINLVSLKNYSQEKFSNRFSFENEVTVFYYRADNLTDEQKEAQIDFRNYDNDGKWYVLLDEAHKGSNEDSLRQSYYSILSRNGFLFNFSATFVDKEDLMTTVYNYNLKEFIAHGYGKHIILSDKEFVDFKEKEINDEEKRDIVIRSLITLAIVKKLSKQIRNKDITYHEPMMVTLVNSVSARDSDLVVFFKTLVEITGSNRFITKTKLNELKEVIKKELLEKEYLFENEKAVFSNELIDDLTVEELRELIFGSSAVGSIEVIQGKVKEIAFKLKTAEKPFGLIKIGDISSWTNNILDGYEMTNTLREESFFSNLDKEENVSILMGSRAFFEGWDSLRPNVINFINIGTGKEAKRYILQSIGRGVRLFPIKNKMMRAKYLVGVEPKLQKVVNKVGLLESLFIYATNKKSIASVLDAINDQTTGSGNELEISLYKNIEKFQLLIPIYKTIEERRGKIARFFLDESAFDTIKSIFTKYPDSLLVVKYGLDGDEIKYIKENLSQDSDLFKIDPLKKYSNIEILINKIITHTRKKLQVVKEFKKLDDEIIHFKHIKTYLEKDKHDELVAKIEKAKTKPVIQTKEELKSMLSLKKIDIDEYTERIESLKTITGKETFKDLSIEYVSEHYYIPLILSSVEKPEYIKHIISVSSEVKFVNKLNQYNKDNDINYKWMFSKLDESLDSVYIPYFSKEINDYRKFNPDFIFWIEKESEYLITFVDPKGTSHSDYMDKIDGYKELFEGKNFLYKGKKINTKLYLVPEDENSTHGEEYKEYWLKDIKQIFN